MISLAVLTVAALSPALSNASVEKTSVKACASAFASSIAGQTSSPGYKVDYRGGYSGSTLSSFYPSDVMFSLEARDPKTGAAIARATCSVDAQGKVQSLTAIPLGARTSYLQF
jgi:hypothetical protein